ncbi:MAG: chemotaxis protein CheD [Oscillospiraceae bacterium]|jgi:chemotaxis protein CheD|nr:chemotaxis protein CheD [Oscillospiraceae bacterium]
MGLIVVGMADLKTAKAPDILTTLGLGSCVGITLVDKAKRIGGLAHVMLPTYKGYEGQNIAKFADSAIIELINQMTRIGATRGALVAKIAGGAHMFGKTQSNDALKIGERNAAASLAILKQLGIPIQANDTGGSHGRTIELYIDTGALKIKSVGAGEKVI